MIEYNEEYIGLLVCQFQGSVSFKSAFYATPSAVVCYLLIWFHEGYPEIHEASGIANLNKSHLWTSLTGVLVILLTFRTNRAMARFWEGTGLLHQMRGEWFDSVSCCVTFSRGAYFDGKATEVTEFRHTIVRLMSLCHGSALEEIAGQTADILDTIDPFGLDTKTLKHLKLCNEVHKFNRVEVLLHLIQSLITNCLEEGVLKIPPPILSRVYQTLSRGFVNLLNAKKIADTRFPFPYAQMIALLLLVQTFMLPVLLASTVPNKVWAPILVFIPLFGFFALNFVGIELENPFGDDPNDLPLERFQSEMNTCLLMLLHDHTDLIPGTSESRCIRDFAVLEGLVSRSHVHTRSCRGTRFERLSFLAEDNEEGDEGSNLDKDERDEHGECVRKDNPRDSTFRAGDSSESLGGDGRESPAAGRCSEFLASDLAAAARRPENSGGEQVAEIAVGEPSREQKVAEVAVGEPSREQKVESVAPVPEPHEEVCRLPVQNERLPVQDQATVLASMSLQHDIHNTAGWLQEHLIPALAASPVAQHARLSKAGPMQPKDTSETKATDVSASQSKLLARSVDSFNDTLQQWSLMVKDQIALLNSSIAALNQFHDMTRAAAIAAQMSEGPNLSL
eukprot:TRINITY_DN55106_c0_g1_i1.p1 TRINITY_DN55106_c0_g1~~TRINITY_DN55106_c0_g1_i1.p1  ORF type:complete len:620 (-),score=117.49 TRINITY_DN55106_c0_g1_i1:9-1868(-)